MPKILNSCSKWSDLPDFVDAYLDMASKGDANLRMFGYASLINDHNNERAGSPIEPENAVLSGAIVAMNVLAVGPKEFRGTYSTINSPEDTKSATFIRNIGCYAGLQPSDNNEHLVKGLNIVTEMQNASTGLAHYMKRELGDPPVVDGQQLKITDLFDNEKKHLFKKLEGHELNDFQLYSIMAVEPKAIDKNNQEISGYPAVTVVTNEKSKFAQIYRTDNEENLKADIIQSAVRICDGQGITRKVGESMKGGKDMDYFYNMVYNSYKELKIEAPIIEKIHEEIKNYLHFNHEVNDLLERKRTKPSTDYDKELTSLLEEHGYKNIQLKDKDGSQYTYSPLNSPYFGAKAQMVERDDVVTEQNIIDSDMPKTGREKIRRLAKLYEEKFMDRSNVQSIA